MVRGRSQVGMQRRHDLGPFADRSGDALDRLRAHVADRKYAAMTRFQGMTFAAGILTGQHETFAIELDAGA